ncbi:hypothetical protein GQ457_03G018730 [Hibiscus cannabinus]
MAISFESGRIFGFRSWTPFIFGALLLLQIRIMLRSVTLFLIMAVGTGEPSANMLTLLPGLLFEPYVRHLLLLAMIHAFGMMAINANSQLRVPIISYHYPIELV